MQEIFDRLEAIYPMSEGLKAYLVQVVQPVEVAKRKFLLEPGKVARHLYFIAAGQVRCYYIKDGDEVSTWFMGVGDVITSVLSFYRQRASFEYIQALEDCELYSISHDDLQYIYRNFLEFNFIARVLTEEYYMQSEERLFSIRRRTAKERYRYLVECWPKLLMKIPQKYIASYIDMGVRTMRRSKVA